jgi:three-Cys-motif partner protein
MAKKRFELAAPGDDGLITPEVGPWSQDKHHFLRRYLDAFTTAMKSKPWGSLHYIDLFAGAGIERVVDEGELLGLDWGSPLIAAQLPVKFQQLHLVELDNKKASALAQRLKKFPHVEAPQVLEGDANKKVAEILARIPANSLSVAFLDPYGLHLHFKTLQVIATRRVDLIIFFPDHVDALRNWEKLYAGDLDSNLDLVLGGARWREEKARTPQDGWVDMLSRLYIDQIRTLGYSEFEHERIYRSDRRPLYKLIFCARHRRAAEIWRNVSNERRDRQKRMDW